MTFEPSATLVRLNKKNTSHYSSTFPKVKSYASEDASMFHRRLRLSFFTPKIIFMQ